MPFVLQSAKEACMYCITGLASGMAAAGCRVAFRAPGFAPRLRGGRGALVAYFSLVRVQPDAACCVALRVVGCDVSFCLHCSSVRWVLPAVSALGLASVLPFCVVGRLLGRLYVLESTFWRFLLLFALLHLFPPFPTIASLWDMRRKRSCPFLC